MRSLAAPLAARPLAQRQVLLHPRVQASLEIEHLGKSQALEGAHRSGALQAALVIGDHRLGLPFLQRLSLRLELRRRHAARIADVPRLEGAALAQVDDERPLVHETHRLRRRQRRKTLRTRAHLVEQQRNRREHCTAREVVMMSDVLEKSLHARDGPFSGAPVYQLVCLAPRTPGEWTRAAPRTYEIDASIRGASGLRPGAADAPPARRRRARARLER